MLEKIKLPFNKESIFKASTVVIGVIVAMVLVYGLEEKDDIKDEPV